MELRDFFARCKNNNVYEERCLDEDYGELVFYMKEIDEWSSFLSDILSPPIKAAGERPSKEAIKITEKYGGIWVNQTLYKKEFKDYAIVAMCWPWSDNEFVTLKVAKERF